MNGPTSGLDRLIAIAKAEPVSGRERGWAAMEIALAENATPSVPVEVAAPATATVATWGGLKTVLVAIVSAAAVVGTGMIATHRSDDGPPRAAAAPTAAPVAIEVAATLPPAQLPAVVPVAPIAAPPVPPGAAIAPARPTPRPDASATAASPDDALEDVRLLGRAWQAIRESRFDDALALTDEHARRFAHSTLVPEREACRVVAMCERGDAEALAAARQYLGANTHRLHAKRVRGACEKLGSIP